MRLKKTITRIAATLLFGVVSVNTINAQVDTLHVGEHFGNAGNLKEGVSSYIHYREMADGSLIPFSIKKHTISKDGDQLKIVQEESADGRTHSLETWVDPITLETSFHNRTNNGELESYIFSDTKVIANSELESKNKDFSIDLGEPTFNFEIDFQFMQAIPWAELDSVVINFYHPGGRMAPQYYTYVVKGSEEFELANGQTADTWKIYTDYNSGMVIRNLKG